MKRGTYIFTSESVGEGHPDKVCDQVSDAILDAFLEQDENSRVAIECAVKDNFILVCGEATSKGKINLEQVVKKAIVNAGYDDDKYGFNGNTCEVEIRVSEQSPDIAQGVDEKEEKEQGAGDQGLMFGYATNETPEFMPLPIVLAHKLMIKRNEIRKKEIPYLGPDAKTQVSVEYEDDKPKRIDSIVFSTQHDEGVEYETLKKDVIKKIINPVCEKWLDKNTKYHINPTGKFVIGGPAGDSGLTGRKIIVDTYGGHGSHGGGAFSGKDPTKVDRSAAYMVRYIAKNIVGAKLADKCEVQIAYAIGIAEPVSILIDCFETNKIPEHEIEKLVKDNFPLKPAEIIKHLDLKRPIFSKTAKYGHFGRNDPDFAWEKLDKVDALKKSFS